MKFLVLGINRSPEPIGIAPYTTDLTRWLARAGHDVAMVAAQPYYPAWQISEGYSAHRWVTTTEDGVSVTRCPLYIPSNPNGLRRIIHHASFAISALIPTLALARRIKPDVILTVAPSLLSAPIALAAARMTGARAWLHVQDFEVEAAVATGLLPEGGIVARVAAALEATLLRRFNRVSTISPRMCERLIEKGADPDRVVEFRNWTDLSRIRPLSRPSDFRKRWGITTPHVALYSGNLANKQGIEIVIEAARRLSHRAADLTFVICGNGSSQAQVADQTAELPNVQLHDLQPYGELSELLGLASVHLLPQVAGAADLVLPSKLTNMLASGRPVVATALPGTGLADEVYGCGLITKPNDCQAFADAIQTLIDDPIRHAAASAAARRRAEERWSRDTILNRVQVELESLAK